MTTIHPNSIALLIDADNAPAGKIDFILSELAGHGVVNIRRAYGNWTSSVKAKAAPKDFIDDDDIPF